MTKLQNIVGTHGNKMWLQILDWILKIGHYQILRRKITYELNTACKFEAKHMEAALQTLNTYVYYYTIYWKFIYKNIYICISYILNSLFFFFFSIKYITGQYCPRLN